VDRYYRGVGRTIVQLISDIRGLKIGFTITNEDAYETVVFLHGFTGSTKTWEPVIENLPENVRYIAIDLLGHGTTTSPSEPRRYEMQEQLADLHELIISLQVSSFALVGYSMGGRIALAYAIAYPTQVKHLVLESASPGLTTLIEQKARIVADEKLADKIETEGLESFVDFWQNIPLFNSQKKLAERLKKNIRQERLHQSPLGLVNSLKGIGTGRQPSFWPYLEQLKIPVTLLTGELDQKFNLIAKQMNNSIANCQHIEVSSVGHAIHVENPVQFATIIKEQLKDLI